MASEGKHIALNDPDGVATYTPGDQSPSGLGYLSRYEEIGTVKEGFDKQNWIVKGVTRGKGKKQTIIHRWVKVKVDQPDDGTSDRPPKKRKKALYVEPQINENLTEPTVEDQQPETTAEEISQPVESQKVDQDVPVSEEQTKASEDVPSKIDEPAS